MKELNVLNRAKSRVIATNTDLNAAYAAVLVAAVDRDAAKARFDAASRCVAGATTSLYAASAAYDTAVVELRDAVRVETSALAARDAALDFLAAAEAVWAPLAAPHAARAAKRARRQARTAKRAAYEAVSAARKERLKEQFKADLAARREVRRAERLAGGKVIHREYAGRTIVDYSLREVQEAFLPLVKLGPVAPKIQDGIAVLEKMETNLADASTHHTVADADAREVNNTLDGLHTMSELIVAVREQLLSTDRDIKGQAQAIVGAAVASFRRAQAKSKGYQAWAVGSDAVVGHAGLPFAEKAIANLLRTRTWVEHKEISNKIPGFEVRLFGSKITLIEKSRKVTMTVKKFCQLLSAHDVLLCVDTVAKCERYLSPFQKVMMASLSGLEVKGLNAEKGVGAVIDVKKGGKSNFETASFVAHPFGDEFVANVCKKHGFTVVTDADNYAKHGYIQKVELAFALSAFIQEVDDVAQTITTAQPLSNLAVRLAKQVKEKTTSYSGKCDYVVIAGTKELLSAIDSNTATQDEIDVATAIVTTFLAGAGIPNKAMRQRFGTHRQVGAMVLGQKVVVGDGEKIVDPLLAHLLLNGSDRKVVAIGANSVKSVAARAALPWEKVAVGNGVEILVAMIKDVDFCITESACTNAWEKVQVELQGLEAHTASVVKRVSGARELPLMQMVYTIADKEDKPAYQVLEELEVAGLIRRKSLSARCNTQMLQSLRSNFGAEQAEALLEALMLAPKAVRNVQAINLVVDMVEGDIPAHEISPNPVTVVQLRDAVLDVVYNTYGDFSREWSISQHIAVVSTVLNQVLHVDSKWVRIGDEEGKQSMLFPTGKKLAESHEAGGIGTHVILTGMLAELVEALWYYVGQAVSKDTLEDALAVPVTLAQQHRTMSNLVAARDKIAGKALARIEGLGSALTLVTSCYLAENEVDSHVVRQRMRWARKTYNEDVGVVVFKSPTIMEHQVRRAVYRDLDAMLVRTKREVEIEALLDGTSGYVSPYATVLNGDDADGDIFTALVLPESALLAAALGDTCYRDPSNPWENAMHVHQTATVEKEHAGLFVDLAAQAPAPRNVYTFDEIRDSVIKAGAEKAKVAQFTTSMMRVQEQEALVEADIEEFLSDRKNFLGNWDKGAFAVLQAKDLKKVARTIRQLLKCIQGAAIQLDAMNLIKTDEGQHIVKAFAEALAPRAAARATRVWNGTEPECVDHKSKLTAGELEGLAYFMREKRHEAKAEDVAAYLNARGRKAAQAGKAAIVGLFSAYKVDFGFKGINLDFLAIRQTTSLQIIAHAMYHALANVGRRMETEVCLEATIMRNEIKYAGENPIGLEGLKDNVLNAGKTIVSYDCVQTQLVSMAAKYRWVTAL